VTTDLNLEDVHFRRAWHPAESVGHRCLARGLSDIAAMGGEPLAAFLSLGLPAQLPQSWVDAFLRGLLGLSRRFHAPLAGGDIAQSTAGILADIMVVGSVPRGEAILRCGARPGDVIYVTGNPGSSAAALGLLRNGKKLRPRSYPAHFFPTPRIEIGRYLRRERLASAMIDVSDGISTDLEHICQESEVGAVLWTGSMPSDHLEYALHGGEDYELLFTAAKSWRVPAKIGAVPVTAIGEIIPSGKRQIWLEENGRRRRLKIRGWEHFSRKLRSGNL